MGFDDRKVWIKFFSPTDNVLRLSIGYNPPYQRFQRLTQFCRAPLLSLLTLESLYIDEIRDLPQRHRRKDAETTQWLELFQSFSNVRRLFISEAFCSSYRASPARACRGEGARRVTRPEVFLFGRASVRLGGHLAIRCHTTAPRSLCSLFSVGQEGKHDIG